LYSSMLLVSMLTSLSLGLTAAEQREFQARMDRKQMKEFMGVSHLLAPLLSSRERRPIPSSFPLAAVLSPPLSLSS
jgi:hypothetical protein